MDTGRGHWSEPFRFRARSGVPLRCRNRMALLRAGLLLCLLPAAAVFGAQAEIDHADLTVFPTPDGQLRPVQTAEDWNIRRAAILQGMQQAMGPLPVPRPAPDFDVRITERVAGDGFERITLSFVVEGTDRLPADLYLPASRRADERRPALLALHPTGADGKRIVSGTKPNRQYATELAQRGYIVLAPDYPGFGDLKDYDFNSDRYVSGTMKGIVNHMRCVDFLAQRPEVDAARIGVIGHSLGGHNALFLSAFDERLQVTVTSCGWTPFAYYYGGRLDGWTSDRYMPLIRDRYKLDPNRVPFDFYEVLAAIAPRALYSASPLHDSNFAVAGVREAEPRVRRVFELLDAGDQFVVEYPDCEHDFPPDVRARAYAFIDRVLKFDPVAAADFGAELPRIPPQSPEKALTTFTVHPDFRLELAAAEPDVVDPVAACFDAYCRLYVVEMRGYSEDREQKLGRVRRLEDRDGDGRFEHSVIFADGLRWPTGILPYRGGVFVLAAPDVLYLTDGGVHGVQDGQADRLATGDYPVILTGLQHSNVQGLANSMRWGLDQRVHVATSSSGASLRRADRETDALTLRGRDFSFDPRLADVVLRNSPTTADTAIGRDEAAWQAYRDRLAADLANRQHPDARAYADQRVRQLRTALAGLSAPRIFGSPARPVLRAESGGGQHGMCFDDFGRKFVCQNSDHIQFVRYEDRYAARNPGVPAPRSRRSIAVDGPQAEVFRTSQVEPWRLVRTRLRVSGLVRGPVEGGGRAAGYFTGATGTNIYRGDAWPEEYRGQAFVGDVGSNIVHRKRLTRDGIGFRADRARPGVEFIASTDNWFRPVQFEHGPDGNLYVLDMYRETIEHPASLPPEIKRHLDLTSGRDRGRIYRIIPRTAARRAWRQPGNRKSETLVAWLDSANAWDRETAARLLFERQDAAAIAPLRRLVHAGLTPQGRLHALYSLAAVRNALREDSLLLALRDPHASVREHAVRLAESKLKQSPALQAAVSLLHQDAEIRVRAQVAFSAWALEPEQRAVVLESIARRDASDEIVRFAVVASADDVAHRLLSTLGADSEFRRTPGGAESLKQLAGRAIRNGHRGEVLARGERLLLDEPALAESFLLAVKESLSTAADDGLQQRLEKLAASAREDLLQPTTDAKQLIAACRRLRLALVPEDADVLANLLVAAQPPSVQQAALEVLADFSQPAVASQLLEHYAQVTPAVQQSVVRQLLSRDAWAEMLLRAVQAGQLPPHAVSHAQLNTLRAARSSAVRELARQLRDTRGSGTRAAVFEQYQDVLQMRGDAARGRIVFRRTCTKCHRLEGVGEEIGPGLAAIRNRGAQAVLLNLLDPNREVNPQYLTYVVVTTDGRSVTGLIANETAAGVTLRDGEKTNVTLTRDKIDEMRSTGLSLMPEGLEKQLSRAELADLLRYLMTVQQ